MVKTLDQETIDARAAEFNPPLTGAVLPKVKAPAMKRPEGLSDSEWAIMKAAKNEDVHKRVNAIMAGEATPDADEAAVLLEIVVGAERAAVMDVVKLRKSIAPKMRAAQAVTATLGAARERLFKLATDI